MSGYRDWLSRLQIPWLVGREFGSAEWGAYGDLLDGEVAKLNDATQASFPEKCAADALPPIASELQLPQGYLESEAAHRIRLRNPWDPWQFAGQHLGLLLALYLDGYTDAILVQQNGLYHRLTSPLADDPIDSLERGTLGELATALTSSVNPAATPIPAGTAWWTFDSDIELCSRFAVLLPTQPPFWRHTATVEFDGTSEIGTAVWSNPFDGIDYVVQVGAVYSDVPVTVVADPATMTRTGVGVVASDPFTGTVELIAYPAGENPFCCPDETALENLRQAIRLWRPGKATCEGIYALVQGEMWDWPVGTWDEAGGTWGPPGEVLKFDP